MQTSFAARQLPVHELSWHWRPGQQSSAEAHDSLGCRHCERQVKLSGLQKPTQHSKSCMQVAPAALHIAPRQSPMLQLPSQQSKLSLQAPPVITQIGPRQTNPVHVEPVQQSEVSTQFAPGPLHVAVPTQRPEMQSFEQQVDALVQPSPIAPHPHTPFLHWPSQQSV